MILANDDEGQMIVEQHKLCVKVLRLNLSEVFQYLNAQPILNEMVEKKLITPQKKGQVECYTSKYAQNISAGKAMFSTMENPTFLLSLCDILEGTDCPDQMKLAVKLRSGMCSTTITKCSSALYIGMAKILSVIDVLGYDGHNSSFSSPSSPPPPHSDSTSITKKGNMKLCGYVGFHKAKRDWKCFKQYIIKGGR